MNYRLLGFHNSLLLYITPCLGRYLMRNQEHGYFVGICLGSGVSNFYPGAERSKLRSGFEVIEIRTFCVSSLLSS